jgi:hypothetical protein
MSTIPSFPLQWPAGWKRTAPGQFMDGRFGKRQSNPNSTYAQLKSVSVAEAVTRVREELQRMRIAGDDVVISTNLALRLDGWPRSDQAEPRDSGAAVYWRDRSGATRCMAIDRYRRVADNLAAIAATLEAMRAIERHGGAEILDRAFTGFAALPAPLDWRAILGFAPGSNPTRHDVDQAYRRLASKLHPDKGGFADDMADLNAARDAARESLA